MGLGIVAEKAQSNFVAAVTGTVPRAPHCVGGGAFFLRRAREREVIELSDGDRGRSPPIHGEARVRRD